MSPRICIFGTGAIGGLLAARLASAGLHVNCIARGAAMRAMQSDGLRLIDDDGEIRVDVNCTDSPAQLGEQDFVFVTLKAHSVADNVDSIAHLLGPATAIITAQNGVPWWYFHKDASAFAGKQLDSVDPDGRIWNTLGPERAVGAVVYPSAGIVAPGVVKHLHGDRFTVGEPGGDTSPRVIEIRDLLCKAGLQTTVSENIRDEVWLKLSVNAAINPLSLVRRTTIGEILGDAADRQYLIKLIRESQDVARSLGVAPLMSPEELTGALESFGAHKTSMLIDHEHGRGLELEALTGAVLELAKRMRAPTPALSNLYAQACSI